MSRGRRRIAAVFLVVAVLCQASPGFGFVVPSAAPIPDKRPGRDGAAIPAPVPKPGRPTAEVSPEKGGPDEAPVAEAVPCTLKFGDYVDVPAVVGENGCGFSSAVRLAGVNGAADIGFSPKPTVNCRFAGVLSEWLEKDLPEIAVATTGEKLKAVHVGPGYQCRRRNNLKDGKLSEHALGNALDVLSFEFMSGDIVSVENDWSGEDPDREARRKFLRAVHASACKRFTTVLGPEADEYHQSHIHVDIGCHGKTCTYRICQ